MRPLVVAAFLILGGSLLPGPSAQRAVEKQEGRVVTRANSRRDAATPSSRPTGRVVGVFVGISEYADPEDNLDYTAADARKLHQALMRGAGMRASDGIVLVDDAATLANVRHAVETAARQAGPADTFIFFFSGHGDRVRRRVAQSSDPDGYDETIDFYDGGITDDELRHWLDGVNAGKLLIVLDSCFSGGFAKDVISTPGRMGLFSSEEDILSDVAGEFRAGGYLAKFMADAIGRPRADENRDGAITAVELSEYLHERYRQDVQANLQHLVVDRGSIATDAVLFHYY